MEWPWPVRPVELPGRGVGLVAVRDIAPGEIVMQEEPLILYPNEPLRQSVCGCCLRMLVAAGGPSSPPAPQPTAPCSACGTRCETPRHDERCSTGWMRVDRA